MATTKRKEQINCKVKYRSQYYCFWFNDETFFFYLPSIVECFLQMKFLN